MEVFYADVFCFIELLIYATEMSGYGEPDLRTANFNFVFLILK